MAGLPLTVGQTFSADDYAEDVGQFQVDFSQFATNGAVTLSGQAPEFSNADVAPAYGIPALGAMITAVDPNASSPFGLGTVTVQDVTSSGQASGAPYSADIIAESNGQILLGKWLNQPPLPPNDTTNSVDPYDGQYAVLSSSSLSQAQNPPATPYSLTVTNPHPFEIPCFAAGTRIATPTGEAAVEAIVAGDLVLTVAGKARPVVWVGRRRVDITRHRRPELVRPVLIEAGAVADGVPLRDVVLSPDHAVFANGVLIPVKYLVNGTTVRLLDVTSVTYHHIELAEHDVVLADGLPAETFLDTGNRANFADGTVVAAHPDFGTSCDLVFHTWEARGYARLVLAGPELDAARARIARRARQKARRAA